jgi:hypothetical protein
MKFCLWTDPAWFLIFAWTWANKGTKKESAGRSVVQQPQSNECIKKVGVGARLD